MAQSANGVVCYWATATANASGATNVVGELTGFSGPNMTAAVIDVTTFGATAHEKVLGVYDGGQITLNLNFEVTNDNQRMLRECMVARTKGRLQIQLSTATTAKQISCKGYVSAINFSGAVDNKLASEITLAITGGASFTTG
jgi:hypothetical protein